MAQTVGSHVLRIDGCSHTKGLASGVFIRSETFAVGGHAWYIRYYPDGANQDAADWIAFGLYLDDAKSIRVNVQFTFSLLDLDGEPVSSHTMASHAVRFVTQRPGYCFPRFIRRKDLQRSVYLRDDVFSVRCDINMSKQIFTAAVQPFVEVPPSDMHLHYARLLLTGDGADVTFEVAGEMFAAHRFVLAARSPVFKDHLSSDRMNEETTSHVHITDVEARVFRAMLHFVYTDRLPHIDEGDEIETAQRLLAAAHRYGLERLKLICEDTLGSYIDASTAAATLMLAEQHSCVGLKNACIKFLAILSNFEAVKRTDGFRHLEKGCPSVLKALYMLYITTLASK